MKAVVSTLRALRAAVIATASTVPPRRFIAILAAIVILVAVALLVPLPTAVQLRDWATSVGPWFPLAFLAAHIVVTVFPFPRTAFTLAAGLLFGPYLGVPLAVLASTAERRHRAAAGARRGLAAEPAGPAPPRGFTGRAAARARLACGRYRCG